MEETVIYMKKSNTTTGGEGSKGGNIIGHTKSGKPVYGDKSASHNDYQDFSSTEHSEAAKLHEQKRDAYNKEITDDELLDKYTKGKTHPKINNRDEHDRRMQGHQNQAWNKRANKANDDELQKGEGDKGGKVIGHTKSGKPIYDSFDNANHASFTSKDHKNAAYTHFKAALRIKTGGLNDEKIKQYTYHNKQNTKHLEAMLTKEKEEEDTEKGEQETVIFDSTLQKAEGGEGSRGGKVIGHTKSGKPIYDSFGHTAHQDFTSDEHDEASQAHYDKTMYYSGYSKNKAGHFVPGGVNDKDKVSYHRQQEKLHFEATDSGKKHKAEQDAAVKALEEKKKKSPEYKLLIENKKTIYEGLMALGHKYFDGHGSGFLYGPLTDMEFGIIDPKQAENPNDSLVDDAYYLGGIFNSETGKIEELPGYTEHEGNQITPKFVKQFYSKNPGKYLVSFDASLSDISIIMNHNKGKLKKSHEEEDQVIYSQKFEDLHKDNSLDDLVKSINEQRAIEIEAAGKPCVTMDFIPESQLNGKQVILKAIIKETGEQVEVEVSAKARHTELKENFTELLKLIETVG